MNREQQSFQFEFYSCFYPNGALPRLLSTKVASRTEVRSRLIAFQKQVCHGMDAFVEEFGLIHEDDHPDYFIVLAPNCRFDDNFYTTRTGSISVLALGGWKKSLAPPSLLEFVQVLAVGEALRSFGFASTSGHLGNKACIADFTYQLVEARHKVLRGFICAKCTSLMHEQGLGAVVVDAARLIDRNWIGLPSDPRSVAGIAAKLKYPLFIAKGAQATAYEQFINTLRSESAKQILTVVAAITVALVLFFLGVKGS